jgi:Domain of unknown function (DUF5710)
MLKRIWLDVPFEEKDQAKAAGARWDRDAKSWFAPRPGMDALARWAALSENLPGEDRSFGGGLSVDLIPKSAWFTNVRSCVSPEDWERLRTMVTRRAWQRCEFCSANRDPEMQRRLEVHERWAFDDASRVQTLRRLVCICSDCHAVVHYGVTQIQGDVEAAFEHLIAVAELDVPQAKAHVLDAFRVWEERSQHQWDLDLSMLTKAGITVSPPATASDRQAISETTTQQVRAAGPGLDDATSRVLLREMQKRGYLDEPGSVRLFAGEKSVTYRIGEQPDVSPAPHPDDDGSMPARRQHDAGQPRWRGWLRTLLGG